MDFYASTSTTNKLYENGVLVESRNGNINMIDVEFNEVKYEIKVETKEENQT